MQRFPHFVEMFFLINSRRKTNFIMLVIINYIKFSCTQIQLHLIAHVNILNSWMNSHKSLWRISSLEGSDIPLWYTGKSNSCRTRGMQY